MKVRAEKQQRLRNLTSIRYFHFYDVTLDNDIILWMIFGFFCDFKPHFCDLKNEHHFDGKFVSSSFDTYFVFQAILTVLVSSFTTTLFPHFHQFIALLFVLHIISFYFSSFMPNQALTLQAFLLILNSLSITEWTICNLFMLFILFSFSSRIFALQISMLISQSAQDIKQSHEHIVMS